MATRDQFTDEEWKTLLEGPAMAAAAIAAASPGGGLGEMYGMLTALRDGAPGGNSDLVNALITTHKEEVQRLLRTGDISLPTEPGEARAAAIEGTRTAAAIADLKASTGAIPVAEADAYKRFLYHVAEKVAESGKEGAFLGLFGGVRVSEAEKQVLNKLSILLASAQAPPAAPTLSTPETTGATLPEADATTPD
jgi:hypothetical protein